MSLSVRLRDTPVNAHADPRATIQADHTLDQIILGSSTARATCPSTLFASSPRELALALRGQSGWCLHPTVSSQSIHDAQTCLCTRTLNQQL